MLAKVVDISAFMTYQPNETIITENSTDTNMYWILSGTCRNVKFMPFLKRKGLKGEDITIMCTKDTQLRKDEKPVNELVTLFDYQAGDYFPLMPLADVAMMQHRSLDLKSAFLEMASRPLGFKSAYSIIASSVVQVMAISWRNYVSIATVEMLKQILEDNHLNFTEQDVVAAYEARVKWDAFKKKTSEEVTAQSRKSGRG
eukprot:jgi/Hompol1/92/HPOL_005222-RA